MTKTPIPGETSIGTAGDGMRNDQAVVWIPLETSGTRNEGVAFIPHSAFPIPHWFI
jgi:hypothetical protein